MQEVSELYWNVPMKRNGYANQVSLNWRLCYKRMQNLKIGWMMKEISPPDMGVGFRNPQ